MCCRPRPSTTPIPRRVTEQYLGVPPPSWDRFRWPLEGPGFRPEQHRWGAEFPFPGGRLNRLCVHPALVDFVARALDTREIRLYQAQVNAKYIGAANYEQPLHTDRNHSWLPAHPDAAWWHVETFVYLSDVTDGTAPTHLVPLDATRHVPSTTPFLRPDDHLDVYAAEQSAPGRRGSVLVYRTNVFHRGVDLTEPNGAWFLLNVSYKVASHEWIAYTAIQPRDHAQLREVRGALDTARARAARLSAARSRSLDASAPRPHRAALPRAGSHSVAERAR